MCGIHDEHVQSSLHQMLHPLVGLGADTYGRPDDQAPQLILAGLRVFATFLDVLDGDQPFQTSLLIDDRQFLDAMAV